MTTWYDRVRMTTATTGTGAITLGSSVSSYQAFPSAANATTVYYTIEDGSAWEVGKGTYTHSTLNLTRTVYRSSNSNNAINLSGSAEVFMALTGEVLNTKIVQTDIANTFNGGSLTWNAGVGGYSINWDYSTGDATWSTASNVFNSPIYADSDLYVRGVAPKLYILETDQVDPAGQFRFTASGNSLILQKATSASWAATSDIFTIPHGTAVLSFTNGPTVAGSAIYYAGGTDVPISDGGTGASTAADARTNLGLGSIATQAASSVSITGGSISGITDLAVADGGTGASTAADARTNLGAAASGANTDLTSVYLNNTGLKIKDTNASHGLTIAPGSDLTADRTLTITTGDAARTVTLSGDLTVSAATTISSFGATIVDDANAGDVRTTIGAAASGANTDLTSVYLNNTGLKIKDTNASHGLTIAPGSDLTADRTLTITTGDAARTVTLSGDLTVGGTSSINGTAYVSGGTDVAVADGGTNISSYTAGDMIYASGTTTLAKLAAGASGTVLTGGTTPAWSAAPQLTTIELGHASDTTIARSAAGRITVEGAAVKLAGKETIWIPAGAMVSRTTNGAASGTTESTTNKVMQKTLDFDQTTAEYAQFTVAFPKSWNEGTVTFIPYWTASAGTATQTCIFSLAGVAVSDDDVIDAAFGTAVTSSDALLATGDLHVGPESSAITIAGTPAAGDLVFFQVARDISDTLAGDAKLLGIKLLFTTDAAEDT